MFNEADICRLLPQWRKASCMKQKTLADMLGVSQATISNWENGKDVPGKRLTLRLADAMSASSSHRFEADRVAIANAQNPRAAFDLDGVRLVVASRGMHAAWPSFSKLTNIRLIESLVDEASLFLHDNNFVKSARRGEVAIVTAVSKRHVEIDVDNAFLHRWSAVFRSYGAGMHVDMTYDVCAPSDKRGVESVVFYDDLISV
jgi:transcriptional regulator with XRE-family HTH domain